MTNDDDYAAWGGYAGWAGYRIAELERWQNVDLENYKRHLAELTEMLTAATDTAMQRGKQLDDIRKYVSVYYLPLIVRLAIQRVLDGADGG